MTKGKKWTLRLLGVAALALLICLCLLGSTMARYTSKGDGTGSLTVAIWDLETTDVTVGADDDGESISPSKDEYSTSARSNKSSWLPAFEMVNNSAVAAEVTIVLDEEKGVSFGWADGFADGDDWGKGLGNGDDGDTAAEQYGQSLLAHFKTEADFLAVVNDNSVFTILLSDSDATQSNDGKTSLTLNLGAGTGSEKDEDTCSASVYAEVVWTSILCTGTEYTKTSNTHLKEDFASAEEYSDAVDTILGMYASAITFTVDWIAVQNSVIPNNG